MKIKRTVDHLWKLPICTAAFFIGMVLSGVFLPMLGLHAPEMPEGTDASTVAFWFLVGSLVLALPLSSLSRNLSVRTPRRWLILFMLTWGIMAIGMVLESYFFMDTDAVSSVNSALFTILNFALPSLFLTGAITWLFPPADANANIKNPIERAGLTGRLAAALLAYPAAYFIFGLLVQPFVMEFYSQGQFELSAPAWEQLIPLQLARSALFLIVCLPLIRFWNGSRLQLWISLGSTFFVMTAFMPVITAYWFPWRLRGVHGLELLADGMVYSAVLVRLFSRQRSSAE